VWNVKTKAIPVKWATGTTSKSFRKYLSKIPGQHDIKILQETVTFCTAHMLQKVIMKKC